MAFHEALDTYQLKQVRVNVVDGVMEAYNSAYQPPVIISLSQSNGMKVWYLYEGKRDRRDLIVNCKNLLKNKGAG